METGKQVEAVERTKLVDDCLRTVGSVYKLVILAARRAVEVNDGSPKLVETPYMKPALIALEEIRQGKVTHQPTTSEDRGKSG